MEEKLMGAKASISITRMPIVYRFRSSFFASLSLSLSLLPFSSQETSTSPFSFPIGGNGLRFFNGVPLV